MTKQFAIAARDHGASVTDQRFHSVAGGRRLPFVAIQRANAEDDLCDLLARSASAMAVEGLQHPAQPRPLLAGQARIGWNRAALQGGEKAVDRFETIQPVHAERHDRGGGRDAVVNELKMLTVAKIERHIGSAVRAQ